MANDTITHIPGPWTFKDTGHRGSDGPTGFRIEPEAMHYVIAELFDYGPEGEANARLIAAAPDLLRVAQSVVYVAEHSGSNAAFVLRGLVDDARAAIAKATE